MKNKNLVFILGGALAIAVGFIVYLTMFKDETMTLPQPASPPPQPKATGETVVSLKPAFVMFYSDGCGHCKTAMPAWMAAAENLSKGDMVDCISIEVSKNPKEASDAHVQGVPAFKFYPDGFPSANVIDYNGNRSTESFLKFVHSEGKDS